MWQMIAGPGLRCAECAHGIQLQQAAGLLNLSPFIQDGLNYVKAELVHS